MEQTPTNTNTPNKMLPHNLILENRSRLTITGVTDVDRFDEKTVLLYTQQGELTVSGRNLHVNAVNVESGDMEITGDIWSMAYGDKDRKNSLNFIGKLFR